MNKRVLSFMVMIALFQFLKAESRPEAIEKIEVYYYSMTIYSGNSHPLYMNGISFCEFDLECSFHNIQEFAQSFYKHAYYIPDVCLGYEKMMIRGYVPFPSSYSKALCLQDSLSSHSIKKTINIEKEKVVVEYCQFTGIFWVGDQKVFGCLSADVAEVYHIRLKDKCYILKDILNFYDNIREGSGGVPVDTLKTTGYKRTALRTAKEQNRVTHVRAEQCRQVYQPHPINAVRVAKLSDESSVLGNFDEEEMAGQDIVLGGIDYGAKREAQEQVIAACYDSLQYVYQPVDRRSLVNVGMVPSGADTSDVDDSGEERGTVNPDTEWQRMYYYCTDHIGSTRLVLDDSARIAERLMFLPTGEVFMDDQNTSDYHSDFLFSGKELDAETGNYYFGARYLAPRLGIWLSPDPMQLKYPGVSSYAYCMGNPVVFFDPNGKIKRHYYKLRSGGKNKVLINDKSQFDDGGDNVFNLWAHGDPGGFEVDKGYHTIYVNNVDMFYDLIQEDIELKTNYEKYKDDDLTIVLHMCTTAEFAKEISEDARFKDVTIIAPNGDYRVTETQISSGTKYGTGKKYKYTHDITSPHNPRMKGVWKAYKNGRSVTNYRSSSSPGSKGFNYNGNVPNKMIDGSKSRRNED